MRSIIFDTSTIISMASNNLLWLLGPLKLKFNGEFFIPPLVKAELIDRPLHSKRFKLEAMQILKEVKNGNLNFYEEDIVGETTEVTNLSNSIFMVQNNYIRITHPGEMSVLALAKKVDANALAIDERTTRVLVEDPYRMVELLQGRLHTQVMVNEDNLREFQTSIKKVPVIRSSEMCAIAYEMGLFEKYAGVGKGLIENPKQSILDALLWGVKLRGCAISTQEIEELLKIEGFAIL